jgi:hypothetical protein
LSIDRGLQCSAGFSGDERPGLGDLGPADDVMQTADFAVAGIHPLCLETFQIWRALCGPRNCPTRSDLDPIALPRHLLPNLALFDIDQSQLPRFRVRLMGTAIVAGYGAEFTGRWTDEIPFGDGADYWAEHFGRCANLGKPVWGRIRHSWEGRPWILQHWFKAPLTHRSTEINMLLACDVFEHVPGMVAGVV